LHKKRGKIERDTLLTRSGHIMGLILKLSFISSERQSLISGIRQGGFRICLQFIGLIHNQSYHILMLLIIPERHTWNAYSHTHLFYISYLMLFNCLVLHGDFIYIKVFTNAHK